MPHKYCSSEQVTDQPAHLHIQYDTAAHKVQNIKKLIKITNRKIKTCANTHIAT